MAVQIGDLVQHTDTGRKGTVDDVTMMMSDDDKTPLGAFIRFWDEETGMMVRCGEADVQIVEKGQSNG